MPFELPCLLYFRVSKGFLLFSSQMETFPFFFSQFPPEKVPAPKTYARASLVILYRKMYNIDTSITSATV